MAYQIPPSMAPAVTAADLAEATINPSNLINKAMANIETEPTFDVASSTIQERDLMKRLFTRHGPMETWAPTCTDSSNIGNSTAKSFEYAGSDNKYIGKDNVLFKEVHRLQA